MIFNDSKKFKIDLTGKSPAIFLKKEILVNDILIKKLIKYSKINNNINCRLCFHKTKKDSIHNMIVLLNKNNLNTFKFHNHKNSDEFYNIIKGSGHIYIKRNKKIIKKTISDNKYFMTKVDKKIYHKIVPTSDILIFNEIKLNPYE
tara:strand:- start:170 stop:607 length:438 start_codon:yes stop_codon:yes gene_type:complete